MPSSSVRLLALTLLLDSFVHHYGLCSVLQGGVYWSLLCPRSTTMTPILISVLILHHRPTIPTIFRLHRILELVKTLPSQCRSPSFPTTRIRPSLCRQRKSPARYTEPSPLRAPTTVWKSIFQQQIVSITTTATAVDRILLNLDSATTIIAISTRKFILRHLLSWLLSDESNNQILYSEENGLPFARFRGANHFFSLFIINFHLALSHCFICGSIF